MVVRPGRPNAAASSFASGIIREPLHGEETVCPVGPEARLWVASPRAVTAAFITAHELPSHALAARRLDMPVVFELSITNVDKPALEREEIRRRLEQFVGWAPVWLTRAPRFVDKARLFPGNVFAVGADTAARIVAPGYYDNGAAGVAERIGYISTAGGAFLEFLEGKQLPAVAALEARAGG